MYMRQAYCTRAFIQLRVHNGSIQPLGVDGSAVDRGGNPLSTTIERVGEETKGGGGILELGSGQPDFLLDLLLIESERLLDLPLESFLVGPSLPRVQRLQWGAT